MLGWSLVIRRVAATHPIQSLKLGQAGGLSEGKVLALAGIGTGCALRLQTGTQAGQVWVVVSQEEVVNGVIPAEAVHHHHCHVTLEAAQTVTCSGTKHITTALQSGLTFSHTKCYKYQVCGSLDMYTVLHS